jgi:hypothetical protein
MIELAPEQPGDRLWTIRSRRVELWHARSADGLWVFDRLEQASTPWQVIYLPGGITGDADGDWTFATSLADARTGVMPDGWVWHDFEQQRKRREERATRVRCSDPGPSRIGCPNWAEPGTDRCQLHPRAVLQTSA